MAQSKSTKKLFNMAYGLGAAVVIVGALFKIQHWDYGSEILTLGMIVEAIVFAISAFEPVEDDLDWTKVYPELGAEGVATEEKLGAEGLLSQKLDNLLNEAKIDANLMESLGNSMKNFQNAADGLSAASESVASTNKYNEQVTLAANQMEALNDLYKNQVENSAKQAELNSEVVENTERLKEQMESLAKNLSSLNGVRVKLTDMFNAPAESEKIIEESGEKLFVRNWTQENKNWFAAVQVEKKMMTLILFLIIGVAAFNLISMLVMTVNEKKYTVAILRTMGASKNSIVSIFFVLAVGLGTIGVGTGVILGTIGASNIGLIVNFLEIIFGLEVLPKGIYLIDTIPSELLVEDVLAVTLIAFLMTVGAALYPCYKAMHMEPAEALRYE